MTECQDCQQEATSEELHPRLLVCWECIHAYWLTVPASSTRQPATEEEQPPGPGRGRPAKVPISKEEIEEYRQKLNVIPGNEKKAKRE